MPNLPLEPTPDPSGSSAPPPPQTKPRARRTNARRWAALVLLGVIVACVTVAKNPEPARLFHLGPKSPDVASAGDAALSVVHSGPRGKAGASSVIALVLSQPLRELDAKDDAVDLPLTLTPAVPGKWQWVGSSAVQFAPAAGRLPLATHFTVELGATTRALSGAKLARPHSFSFSTPAPRLVRHTPEQGARGVATDVPIVVQFDQPVAPAEVERLGHLTAAGKPAKFRARPWHEGDHEARGPHDDARRSVAVVPEPALPRHARIEFRLEPGLQGLEGPLASEQAAQFSFETFGPLRVQVRCGWERCGPEDELRFEFSNPVRAGALRAHIRTEPALPLRWPEWLGPDDVIRDVSVPAPMKPRSRVVVTVGAGLVDHYGQSLEKPIRQVIEVGDYRPALALGVTGELLEPAGLESLALETLNTGSTALTTTAVSPGFAATFSDRPWDDIPPLKGARTVWLDGGNDNRTRRHAIDLLEVLRSQPRFGASERGALLVELRSGTGPEKEVRRQLLQVTDLALSGKLSRQGSVLWVTRLSTGRPVAGANVSIFEGETQRHRYVSDGAGFVVIPASALSPAFYDETKTSTALVVNHGADWTVRSAKSFLGPWRLPYPPNLGKVDPLTVFLFTERGTYRPGDEVWVKGIARRQADDHSSSAGTKEVVTGRFRLRLLSPNGSVALERELESGQFGTFATRVRVPASAALGEWRVTAAPLPPAPKAGQGDEAPSGASVGFAVAEYRPSEFQVKASASEAHATAGDTATFLTEASYLFGAPMAGATLEHRVSTEPTSFQPPGSDDWITDDAVFLADREAVREPWALLASGRGSLDASGRHAVTTRLAPKTQGETLRVRFEGDVQDVSRQSVSASTSLVLHPASHTIGLLPFEDWFVPAPGTIQPQVRAWTHEGKAVVGRGVTLELIRRRWQSTTERWDGGHRTAYKSIDERVGSCSLVTARNTTTCSLSVERGGYHIVRASSKDAQGRSTFASMGLYALGGGNVTWRDDVENATVEVVPNKKAYRVGETAKLLVKSPFPKADAMLTIERAGVIEHRRLTLEGPTPTVEVPITERLRPNAYVALHLLKHRDGKARAAVSSQDLYRVGYAEVLVDPEERRLDVRVSPKQEELAPGDTVVASVTVKNRAGKGEPAEVTFYAVDEGVLMLTGYRVPDPVPIFTAPRPLQVATLESRADLGRLIDPQLGSDKGTEGGGGGEARSTFKESAYFNPSIVTDEKGHAEVRFQLPDNLTTFRLMAVAVSRGDRYGSGEAKVRVSKPLMARPALPRFLRAGDRFQASVIVTTKGARSRNVTVSARAQGLELEGDPERRVGVEADGTVEVRFWARALRAGSARLDFAVRGEHESDSVTLTRPVKSPSTLETVAAYGETRGRETQRLGRLDEVRTDQGGLEVRLASTRLVGLDGSMEQLVEYPYACSEQLASRLLPLLPLRDLAVAFGFELPKNGHRLAEATVGELLKRQRGDGGFGYWPESPRSDAWLSGYVLWTLHQAKQHRVPMEPAVFTRGIKYLRDDVLHRKPTSGERAEAPLAPDVLAFTVYVLAELGKPDLGALERIDERRAELYTDGLAWLSLAATRARAPKALAEPLFRRLESKLVLDGNRVTLSDPPPASWMLASPARSEALVLSALLAHEPKHPLAGRLATDLLARREGGGWRTTQESAFALLALDAYRRAQEPAAPRFEAKVWAGTKLLLEQPFEGRSTKAATHTLPMQRLEEARGLDVIFERAALDDGSPEGTLFYEARLSYATKELPQRPLDRGLGVEKRVRAAEPSELPALLATLGPSTEVLPAGSLVVVDLLVTTGAPRSMVVIDDPLAAGLEAMDARFTTSSHFASEAGDRAGPAAGFSQTWHRQELRDDRALFFADVMPAGMYHFRYFARATTLGSFVVPPTRVFEMYQPEVYGRTGAGRLRVVDAPRPGATAP